MLLALPLVVPWNMIPMMWLNLIGKTGLVGRCCWPSPFPSTTRFNAFHTWLVLVAMDTWHWLGLVVILSFAGLSGISNDYYRAAAVDGASRLAVFRHIQLPKISGILSIAVLLRFVDSFMIYTEAFRINAGGPNRATIFLTARPWRRDQQLHLWRGGGALDGLFPSGHHRRLDLPHRDGPPQGRPAGDQLMSSVPPPEKGMGGPCLHLLLFAALALFILLPFAQSLITSFISTMPRDDITEGDVSLINFINIVQTPALRESILNSTFYVLLNVLLCLVAGLPAAYAYSRYRFTGDRHFFFLLLIFRVTPPVVLSLPIFILFAHLNLVNTPIGIALVHCLFNIPIAIWVLESFISAVPRELDETAFLDGYSLPGFFVWHLIPAIAPGIGVTAFFCFIFSWVEVVFARILTVTAGKPITMAINALLGIRTDIGLVMAMNIVSLLARPVHDLFRAQSSGAGFRDQDLTLTCDGHPHQGGGENTQRMLRPRLTFLPELSEWAMGMERCTLSTRPRSGRSMTCHSALNVIHLANGRCRRTLTMACIRPARRRTSPSPAPCSGIIPNLSLPWP